MDINKKIILLIAALLMILGILFLISMLKSYYKEEVALCYTEYEDLYYEILAIKNNDNSICNKIKKNDKEYCEAIVLKDQKYCDKYNQPLSKKECLKEILKDPKMCSEDDYWCLAETNRNKNYCNKLQLEEREECTAIANLDAEYFKENKKRLCKELFRK